MTRKELLAVILEHGQKGGYNMAYEGNYTEIPDWFPDDSVTMEPGNDEMKEWQVGYKPPAQWRNWQDKGWFLALKAIDQALADHEAKKGNTHNVGEGNYIAKTSNPNQYPRRQEIVGFEHGNEEHTEVFATQEWVLQNAYSQIFDMIHPVNDVVTRYDDVNPGDLPGWQGTWVRIAENRMLAGQGSDPDFDTAGKTGGEKEHTLTKNEMPEHDHSGSTSTDGSHVHTIEGGNRYDSATTNYGITSVIMGEHYRKKNTFSSGSHQHNIESSGGDQPHNNMPPYEVVYIWRRIE